MKYAQLLIMLACLLSLFQTAKHINKRRKIRALSLLKGMLILCMLCVIMAIFFEFKNG